MAKQIDYIEASRLEWCNTVSDNDSGYPGDEKIKMACLQRIANATESMCKNYLSLQNQYDYMKKRKNEVEEENKRMARRIAGLKGYIKRLKKTKK